MRETSNGASGTPASWAVPLRWSDSPDGEHCIGAEIRLNPKKIGQFIVGASMRVFLVMVSIGY
jgi:hypothetical protein